LSTGLFPPTSDNSYIELRGSGAGALLSCRLRDRYTLESIATNRIDRNQSRGISRTLLPGRSVHGAISTRDVRPTEGGHASAARVNEIGRFGEAGFQLVLARSLLFSRATRYTGAGQSRHVTTTAIVVCFCASTRVPQPRPNTADWQCIILDIRIDPSN
jgi:hypothetical protein